MPKSTKRLGDFFQGVFKGDSGHPTSIEPITKDIVHAALLIFPELASLANKLHAWIDKDMNG